MRNVMEDIMDAKDQEAGQERVCLMVFDKRLGRPNEDKGL